MMSFWNKLSLRTKFILMIGMVTVLLGASSMVGMNQLYQTFREDSEDVIKDATFKLDTALQAQFFERYGDVQAFAVNSVVMDMNAKEIPTALDSYVRLYGIYDVILVVDKHGRYVASNTKDSTGKNVNQDELRKYDYAAAKWFKAAIAGATTDDKKNAYAGTFFESVDIDSLAEISFAEKRPMYGFTSVIKDNKGEVVGVITNRANSKWVDFEIKQTHESLKTAGFKDHGIALLNNENMTLGLFDPEWNKNEDVSYDSEKVLFKRDLAKQFPQVAEELKNGKNDSNAYDDLISGKREIVGFRHMAGDKWIPSIGWNVVIYQDEGQVLADANASRNMFFMTFSFGTVVAMAIGVWFGLSLSRRISGITEILGQNSGNLSEASGKVAISSTQLSEGSTEQAAALQETVAAVDEISAMVDKNAEAANRSKDASAQSRDAAMKGRTNVDNMIEAIADISRSNDDVATQMESSNQQLSEITRMITDIGNKTKVINEIVFQTKLLSFNASVEAARAGEYGKGFAVVAEEVGNLAQMSGNAAKEITELLDQSVTKVQSIVNDSKGKVDRLMAQSQEKVKLGNETAKNCNESLEEILNQVSSVDSLVSEIAVASQEQATGIREIAKAVAQMESVTQQNSSVAEASSVAAEQLSSQSIQLDQLVKDLRVIVTGNDISGQPKESGKVIGMKQFKKKKESSRKVASHSSPEVSHSEPPAVMKKVSGEEYAPDASDPGFEE